MQVQSNSQISQHLEDQKSERKNETKAQTEVVKQERDVQQKAEEAAKITGIGQSLNITV